MDVKGWLNVKRAENEYFKIFLLSLLIGLTISEELIACEGESCGCSRYRYRLNERVGTRCLHDLDFNVEIYYKSLNWLDVLCYFSASNIDKYEINFGKFEKVQFLFCKLTNGLSILKKWNLTDIKELHLERSYNHDFKGVMKRDFVGNISKSSFERLTFELCGVKAIEEDVFKGFENLTVLNFQRNLLTEIPNLFKHLPKLKQLNLQGNKINNFPNNLTKSNLEILNLKFNNITDISKNMFNNVPNVTLLDLSENPIKNLSQNFLRPLKNLNSIEIGLEGDINITDLFTNNKKIIKIVFQGGNITFISEKAFENLIYLRELRINNAKLTFLPKNLFKNNINIEKIMIGKNKLTTLPNGIFNNLKKLKHIDLSDNQLSEWKYEYYGMKLPMLEEIDLSYNNLEVIGSSSFTNLHKLKTLSLSDNKIKSFLRGAFDRNQRITYLFLRNNNLSDVEEDIFLNLTRLENLNLDYNNFSVFPHFTNSILITYLGLSFNKIKYFDIKDLSNFKHVDLTNNLIEKVDFTFFKDLLVIRDTRVLTLDNNPIICDCGAYNLIKYKMIVDQYLKIETDSLKCSSPSELESVLIEKVPLNNFTCQFKSETLEYGYICPEKCTCSLVPNNTLFNIDCSGLGLEELPRIDLFENRYINAIDYTNFYVNLSRNKIRKFVMMENYSSVTSLDLSDNQLNSISWIPQHLKILKLNSNKLSTIDHDVLNMLKDSSLASLRLDGNPWKCDCELNDLVDAIQTTAFRSFLQNHNNTFCTDGRLLIQQNKTQLCKEMDVLVIILISLAVFLVIALIVLSVLYFKHDTTIKIWLYSNNILIKYVTEQDFDKNKKYDAFVSYSHKDESFVLEHLLPELEGGSEPYKLCVHERDWRVGEFINRQIIDSVSDSRRTILVLSKNYLESSWATVEFRTAHTQAMNEKLNRLIVVLYENVTPDDVQDEELKTYLKTTTYIKWGDPWFWKKLKYAMPHRVKRRGKEETAKQKIENISNDENLNLTTSTTTTPNTQSSPVMLLDPL